MRTAWESGAKGDKPEHGEKAPTVEEGEPMITGLNGEKGERGKAGPSGRPAPENKRSCNCCQSLGDLE